jgi:hypothetical protein
MEREYHDYSIILLEIWKRYLDPNWRSLLLCNNTPLQLCYEEYSDHFRDELML